MDRGQIFASGLAFTPKWSSLPLKAGFVVLMQNAVFGAQAEHLPIQPIRAGDDYRFDFPDAQASVASLAGAALDWHGLAHDFAGFPRAGVYAITQRGRTSWVAVSGNVDEADPHFLPLGPVPLLSSLPHVVLPLVHAEDITRAGAEQGAGISLYRWLMLIALLLLLAETWLANERSSDLGRKLFASLLPTAAKRAREKAAEGAGQGMKTPRVESSVRADRHGDDYPGRGTLLLPAARASGASARPRHRVAAFAAEDADRFPDRAGAARSGPAVERLELDAGARADSAGHLVVDGLARRRLGHTQRARRGHHRAARVERAAVRAFRGVAV